MWHVIWLPFSFFSLQLLYHYDFEKRKKHVNKFSLRNAEYFYPGKEIKIIKFNILILEMTNLRSQEVPKVTELLNEPVEIKKKGF